MRLTLARPAIGLVVLLAGCSASDVASPSANPANQLSGPVQSITPPTLNVGGLVVTTSGATVVRRGGARIDLMGLHLGEPVQVRGAHQSADTLEASEIDADDNEVEFDGTVDSIAAPVLWVSGRTVVTDSGTRIKGDKGAQITLADLNAGDTVKVEGAVRADSAVLARHIELDNGREDNEHDEQEMEQDEVELQGAIDSIAGQSLFVLGQQVTTDAATVFRQRDQLITFADLHAGARVEVEGERRTNGAILARKVQLEETGGGG